MNNRLIHFVTHDIWLLPEHHFPFLSSTIVKLLKIVLLAAQGFQRDHCQLRASALTLYSLLAIVPIIAMLFGIAQGFGLERMLEQQLFLQIPHQETLMLELIQFARNLLESTKGEVIAGIGIIVLLWTVVSMISNIEDSFNYIWKISHGRQFSRKVSDYLSLMLLAPMLLILASSISVYLHTKISWLAALFTLPAFSEGILLSVLNYFPLMLMIALFSFTFCFMPNHKVNYQAGLCAGILTGLLYQGLQTLYLGLQIGVSSYNAVYGSFAAVPLFVIWVQTGWMIVLFGCEVTFFIQNYAVHRYYLKFSSLSFSLKKTLALQVMHLIVKNFSAHGQPLTADQIALHLGISIPILQPLLGLLQDSKLVIALKTETDSEIYLPALDSQELSIARVLTTLETCGVNDLPDVDAQCNFRKFVIPADLALQSAEQQRLLKDI